MNTQTRVDGFTDRFDIHLAPYALYPIPFHPEVVQWAFENWTVPSSRSTFLIASDVRLSESEIELNSISLLLMLYSSLSTYPLCSRF